MTKEEALYKFWNSFGIPAYADTTVLNMREVSFPYITYEVQTASHGGSPVNTGVSIWYHTESEKIPNAKADEIAKAISDEGELLDCDDGKILVLKGDPFCINQTAEDDASIKLRFLNIQYKYWTL